MRRLARGLMAATFISAFSAQALAADLTIWWNKSYYPEEDQQFDKIVTDFEKASGKDVEYALDLMDAAQLLGASTWQAALLVVLPNLRQGLMVAVLLSFSFLFGEFVFANLLVGTRYETLQVYLNNMRNSSGHFNSALVISYFAFVLVLTWVANRLNKDKT